MKYRDPIRIFNGYDSTKHVAVNVLTDAIQSNASKSVEKRDCKRSWELRDESCAIQRVKNKHECKKEKKLQRKKQTPYQQKNWSSVILIKCSRSNSLTPKEISKQNGFYLHQFCWLSDNEDGKWPPRCNALISVHQSLIMHRK